jgi:hypothetical protein
MGIIPAASSQAAHSRVDHSRVERLSREMSFLRSDVQKVSCLKDVFSLTGRIEKVCIEADELQSEKVQHTTRDVFQKHGAMELLDQGRNCYHVLEEVEKEGMTRDLSLLREIQGISSKAEDLELQFVLLSPEQIAGEIEELSATLHNISQRESFNQELLESIVKKSLEKVRHLQFRLDFPICEELCEFSYQKNFARNLTMVAQDLKEGGEEGFEALSAHQKEEILRGVGQQSSCAVKSTKTLQYLRKLQLLTHLAEGFLYGNMSKVIDRFERLDDKTKKAIDGLLFSSSGHIFESLKHELKKGDKEAAVLCTSAIMSFVSEQVVGGEN